MFVKWQQAEKHFKIYSPSYSRQLKPGGSGTGPRRLSDIWRQWPATNASQALGIQSLEGIDGDFWNHIGIWGALSSIYKYKAGGLGLSTIDILGWTIPCLGAALHIMRSSAATPAWMPVAFPPLPKPNNQNCLQLLPNTLSRANTISTAQLRCTEVTQKKLLRGHRHTLLSLRFDASDSQVKVQFDGIFKSFLKFTILHIYFFLFTFWTPSPIFKITTIIFKYSRLA